MIINIPAPTEPNAIVPEPEGEQEEDVDNPDSPDHLCGERDTAHVVRIDLGRGRESGDEVLYEEYEAVE